MKFRNIVLGLCGAQVASFSFSVLLSGCTEDKSWESHWTQSCPYVTERHNYWKFWRPSFFVHTLRGKDRQCLDAWLQVISVGNPDSIEARKAKLLSTHSPSHRQSGNNRTINEAAWRKRAALSKSGSISDSELFSSRFFFPSMVLQDTLVQIVGFEELRDFHACYTHTFFAIVPTVRALRRETQGDAVLLHLKANLAVTCRIPFTDYTFQCCQVPSYTTLVLEDLPLARSTSVVGALLTPFRFLSRSESSKVPEISYQLRSYSKTRLKNSKNRNSKIVREWGLWKRPTRRVITTVEHRWFGGRIWSTQTSSVKTPWGDIGDLARRSSGYVLCTLLANIRYATDKYRKVTNSV